MRDVSYKEYIEFKKAEGFEVEEWTMADELKMLDVIREVREILDGADPALRVGDPEHNEYFEKALATRRIARRN